MIADRRSTAPRCVLLIALCLLPSASRADWKREFRDGYRDWERGRFDRAVEAFRRAIADEPTESGQPVTISGMTFRKYYPYFYLGDSLAKSNDCAGAVAAWEASERQGGIRGESDLWADLQRGLQDCRQTLLAAQGPPPDEEEPDQPTEPEQQAPAVAAALRELQQELGRADVARSAFDTARDRVAGLQAPTADLDRQVAAGLRDLQAARTTFDGAGEASLEQLRAAATRAGAAADVFETARRSADDLVGQVQRVRAALDQLATATAGAERALRGSELSQTEEHRALQRLITESRAANGRMDVGQIETLQRRLVTARGRFDEAVRQAAQAGTETEGESAGGGESGVDPLDGTGEDATTDPTIADAGDDGAVELEIEPDLPADLPPSAALDLAAAATAFFERSYDRVLELLAAGEARSPREELAGHLLRAAAHHARYLIAGAADEQELAAAREQVRRCAALDPALDLEALGLGLSPSFRNFYRGSL